jgi:predicted nucleic acid-binding protein
VARTKGIDPEGNFERTAVSTVDALQADGEFKDPDPIDTNVLPQGRRRRALEAACARLLEDDLENRVLNFDAAAATSAASLAADRQRAGRPADMRETQIAGIAVARHAALATRHVRHFADLKVPVVDPWTA